MASKLAAAKIASLVGGARRDRRRPTSRACSTDALAGEPVGTVVQPHAVRLASRKLWIAFAVGAAGRVIVDDGARRA